MCTRLPFIRNATQSHSLTHSLTHAMFPLNTRRAAMFSLLNMAAAATASPSECYVAPSCTATEFYDEVTGFTNDTGFAAPGSSECCQVSHCTLHHSHTHSHTHSHAHLLTHSLTHSTCIFFIYLVSFLSY